MSDVYQPPESDLTRPRDRANAVDIETSIERAVAGDFEFDVFATLKEAAGLISGAKLPILVGALAVSALSWLVGTVGALFWTSTSSSPFSDITIAIAQAVISAPLWAGVVYMGIERAAGGDVTFSDLGARFQKAAPLMITMLVNQLLVAAGFMLLILPGIYFTVAFAFAVPLVIDKGLTPVQALETSRKAVTRCWFRMFALLVLIGLIVLLGVLPLLIGLIWAIPLGVVSMGVAYRSIFGISSAPDGAATAQ